MFLWGREYGDGRLSLVLCKSSDLKEAVLKYLSQYGKLLLGLVDEESPELSSHGCFKNLRCLLDEAPCASRPASTVVDDDDKSIKPWERRLLGAAFGQDGHNSSEDCDYQDGQSIHSTSTSDADVGDALQNAIDCLMDLLPSIDQSCAHLQLSWDTRAKKVSPAASPLVRGLAVLPDGRDEIVDPELNASQNSYYSEVANGSDNKNKSRLGSEGLRTTDIAQGAKPECADRARDSSNTGKVETLDYASKPKPTDLEHDQGWSVKQSTLLFHMIALNLSWATISRRVHKTKGECREHYRHDKILWSVKILKISKNPSTEDLEHALRRTQGEFEALHDCVGVFSCFVAYRFMGGNRDLHALLEAAFFPRAKYLKFLRSSEDCIVTSTAVVDMRLGRALWSERCWKRSCSEIQQRDRNPTEKQQILEDNTVNINILISNSEPSVLGGYEE